MSKNAKKNSIVLIFCLLLNLLSYNVGAASTVPASGVVYGETTVQSALDNLITKVNTGDATAAQILSGRKAMVQGTVVTGTMVNRGTITSTLNAGETFNVPPGYVSGGTVTANSLASQTNATATAADIESGKTAYVNGVKLTGTNNSYSIVKIWTNSAPSTAISSKTISIPTEYQNYKYAFYTNRVNTSSTTIMNSRINENPNSTTTKQQTTTFNYSSDGNIYRRVVNLYSDRVEIQGCTNTGTATTTNGQLIPYEIYLIV